MSPHGIAGAPESKFTKFGEEMFIGQTLTMQNFGGDPTRSVLDIRDRKFVLPKRWAKIHQNRLDLLPSKAPYHAKFHRDC